MAEMLVLVGEKTWVQSRALRDDELCVQHASATSRNTQLQIAFRPGRVPYDGGYGFSNNVALAWIGDWRNRSETLEKEGIAASTIAEELIALWKLRGHAMFTHVHGLMACVLWDETSGQLRAFRDKIGLVPMVYAIDPVTRNIVISSDADWLLEAARMPRVVNRSRLTKFLLNDYTDRGRDDFIHGLQRIRPREYLGWSASQLTTDYYWNPTTDTLPPSEEHPRQFRRLLSEVLESVGDYPHVFEMSGGMDSPGLVAVAVALQKQVSKTARVRTVSMVAPGYPGSDETAEIQEIVDALPLDAHYFSISEHPPLQDLSLFEDFTGSGPQYHPEEEYARAFSNWIRENFGEVDVIGGGGADQLLFASRRDLIRSLLAEGRWQEVHRLWKDRKWHRLIAVILLEQVHAKEMVKSVRDVFLPGIRAGAPGESLLWRRPENWVVGGEPISRIAAAEMEGSCGAKKLEAQQQWLWELSCRGGYRKAKRAGLRTVQPYLDDRLWEFVLRMSPTQLIRGNMPKGLLRDTVASLLPETVVRRPKHSSFDAVVENGLVNLSQEVVQDIVGQSRLGLLGIIHSMKFKQAFVAYQQWKPQPPGRSRGSFPVWSSLSAELWLRQQIL